MKAAGETARRRVKRMVCADLLVKSRAKDMQLPKTSGAVKQRTAFVKKSKTKERLHPERSPTR